MTVGWAIQPPKSQGRTSNFRWTTSDLLISSPRSGLQDSGLHLHQIRSQCASGLWRTYPVLGIGPWGKAWTPDQRTLWQCRSGYFHLSTRERISGSCRRNLPGDSIRIADNDDAPLPPNTPGNLLHGRTYRMHPSSSISNVPKRLWKLCQIYGFIYVISQRLMRPGNVFFLGRTKDLLRWRGENVNAFEVEEEFLRHPYIVSVAVIAVPKRGAELLSATWYKTARQRHLFIWEKLVMIYV